MFSFHTHGFLSANDARRDRGKVEVRDQILSSWHTVTQVNLPSNNVLLIE